MVRGTFGGGSYLDISVFAILNKLNIIRSGAAVMQPLTTVNISVCSALLLVASEWRQCCIVPVFRSIAVCC